MNGLANTRIRKIIAENNEYSNFVSFSKCTFHLLLIKKVNFK
jgi:hypothetical protein